MLKIVRVSGDSMQPTLLDGDFAVVLTWPKKALRPGQVVVVNCPHFGTLIKRVQQIVPNGEFSLSGDNTAASLTTEKMGWFNRQRVIGRVLYYVKRPR
ncbi:hypothetical protein EP12_03005 [Alteromonas australica]|jgi:nickel-type superoxide dismutase maturation protease|nr:hypothetical protein EP12_03005 [Alteromonas australica]|tara:strand:- start:134 stop:427 length:294 start_codon:yes stop_codon:yes gene_type:complete